MIIRVAASKLLKLLQIRMCVRPDIENKSVWYSLLCKLPMSRFQINHLNQYIAPIGVLLLFKCIKSLQPYPLPDKTTHRNRPSIPRVWLEFLVAVHSQPAPYGWHQGGVWWAWYNTQGALQATYHMVSWWTYIPTQQLIQGLYSLRRRGLISIGIPIINLRRSSDRLRFIMGIPIPVRWRLLSE